MTIELSESSFSLAQQQAQAFGFADVNQYLESLIEEANEKRLTRDATLAALQEGLADVAAGRTRPAREVLAELGQKYGLTASGS